MTSKNMRRGDGEGNPLSRRALLSGGAVACLATAAVAAPVALMQKAHPDSAILSAWEEYVVKMRAYHDLPDDLTDAEYQPYSDELHRLRTIIEETPASTAEGMGPKLRILFVEMTCCRFVELAMVGRPSPEFQRKTDDSSGYAMFMDLIGQCDGAPAA
jgi:hypothetical protein